MQSHAMPCNALAWVQYHHLTLLGRRAQSRPSPRVHLQHFPKVSNDTQRLTLVIMDSKDELNDLFGGPSGQLPPEVLGELQSILRLHSISPQELFYKWESYSMKMGAEETQLTLNATRDFKKDLEELLERETRGKVQARNADKRTMGATPRAGAGDAFSMIDGMIPNTPQPGTLGRTSSTAKRKSNFETPAAKAIKSSPADYKSVSMTGGASQVPFSARQNAGDITEAVNQHIDIQPSDEPPAEPRIKLQAVTEMSKFNYKSMSMKLSEASEVLDDRIDEFASIVQAGNGLDESAFGNPAAQSTSEIVAVGRIASDSTEGKLNASSLVLETSRRNGSGLRIPLKLDGLPSYDFFPGKIVALRGINASGEFFAVSEELRIPPLNNAASVVAKLNESTTRMEGGASDPDTMTNSSVRPLSIFVAAGPYTPHTSLDYSALHELLAKALEAHADMLILTGPFLDIEHPCIRNGDVSLPDNFPVQPDQATLNDVFRFHITKPLIQFSQQLPSCQILLVPSVREATSKAVSWPQDRMSREALGLRGQKMIQPVSNPISLLINEAMWGVSSLDVLEQIRASECVGGKAKQENVFVRGLKSVIGQRHYMPVFPPLDQSDLDNGAVEGEEDEERAKSMGAMLDLPYLKLGEFWNVTPDVLVLPSILTPFAKVCIPFHVMTLHIPCIGVPGKHSSNI